MFEKEEIEKTMSFDVASRGIARSFARKNIKKELCHSIDTRILRVVDSII